MGEPDEKKKGLVCIDGVWHYRRRIPDDVRRILREQDSDADAGSKKCDKREEKKRLGRDKLRAEAAWKEHHLQVEARWAQLRKGSVGDLTAVQCEALAGEVYRLWLKRYPPDSALAGYEAARALEDLQKMDEEIPNDNWEMIHLMQRLCVDDVLAARGLIIHPSRCWPLVIAAQRAAQHACRFALQRYKGDMRPDAEAERYPAWPDPATTTLVGLHDKWVQNRQPNAETQRAFRSSIDKLVAFVGFDDVTRLTTADVRRWCASMKEVAKTEGPKEEGSKKERSIGGIRIRDGYLAAVKAVLNSALTMGYVEHRNRPKVAENARRLLLGAPIACSI